MFLAEPEQTLAVEDTAPKQQTLEASLNHEHIASLNHEHIGARFIKEEQEDMWSSQEGEQLPEVETFSLSYIPLKTESREEPEVNSPYLVKCKFNLLT